jgi:hypothetical protein
VGFRGSACGSTRAHLSVPVGGRAWRGESSSSRTSQSPLGYQPITVAAWTMETRAFPAVPDRTEPGPETAVRGGQLRALDRALEDADLMTQREDLELKAARVRNEAPRKAKTAVRTGPKRKRLMSDNSQFINLIGVCGNHR